MKPVPQHKRTQLPGQPGTPLSAVGVVDLRAVLAPRQPTSLSVPSFKWYGLARFLFKIWKTAFPKMFFKRKNKSYNFNIWHISSFKAHLFWLRGGAGWGHSFSVLIFKYLIILYCPIISAPPKGPRITLPLPSPCSPSSPREGPVGQVWTSLHEYTLSPFIFYLQIRKATFQFIYIYFFPFWYLSAASIIREAMEEFCVFF